MNKPTEEQMKKYLALLQRRKVAYQRLREAKKPIKPKGKFLKQAMKEREEHLKRLYDIFIAPRPEVKKEPVIPLPLP